MKIALKEDWDIPIHPPVQGSKRKGHFVGREKELSLLSNEVLRRDSGAILITGYRGVGKTSLVYKAISNVRSTDDDNIVPVLISASQLHDEGSEDPTRKIASQNPKRRIIESIIRRLYATTRTDERLAKFQPAIEDLYKKAAAAKFEQTMEAARENSAAEQITRERVSQVDFAAFFIFALCAAMALLLLFVPEWSASPLVRIVSVVIALPIPLGINYVRKKAATATVKSLLSAEAREVYQFDGSIGNLEFDLERLHRELTARGKKLIYVIDELDKLEPKTVGELLKFFKNLFTLSEALFIFIADEEIYTYNWAGTPAKGRRPLEYTFFTSRYFLSRPTYDDLRTYLGTVTESSEIPHDDLENFFRAISFAAGNDFFDLRSSLTDRITSFDGKRPIIEFSQLSSQDQQYARFHRVFTSLFERKYMAASRSKWQENERLQNALFQHLTKIEGAFEGYGFHDPDGEDIDSQLIRDCNAVLTRVGALKGDRNPQTKTLRGIEVFIHVYKYTGSVPENPPETLTEPSEFERRYIGEVDTYYEYARAMLNAFREADHKGEISGATVSENPRAFLQGQEWDYDLWSPVSNHFELHQQFLIERPLPVVERSEVEKRTKEMSETRRSVLMSAFPDIIARMLIQLHPAGELKVNRLTELPDLFSAAESIRAILQRRNPVCVYTSDFEHQVAIVSGEFEEIRRSAEWLKPVQKTHRIIVIGDFEGAARTYTYGVYFVDTNQPQTLKTSLARVLKSTTAFWSRESEEE